MNEINKIIKLSGGDSRHLAKVVISKSKTAKPVNQAKMRTYT